MLSYQNKDKKAHFKEENIMKVKLYKHDVIRKFQQPSIAVFTEIGSMYLNPAHVKMIMELEKALPLRKHLDEPPLLCQSKVFLTEGDVFYTTLTADELHTALFGRVK